MKVLFVSSGNSKTGITPIVKSQGESFRQAGVDVEFFTIVGKGFFGYLKNILPLKNKFRSDHYELVHAHYSLSAIVATLAGCRPIVASLMGSDVKLGAIFKYAVRIFSKLYWDAVIVKSHEMSYNCRIKDAKVIPNGVDITLFKPIDKDKAIESLGWGKDKKHILFGADPSRPVKNFKLFKDGCDGLKKEGSVETHVLKNIPQDDVPVYMNASEVVVITSFWEGSPNVVKEAMACNCPVVATNVGDVSWLFGGEPGHFIANFSHQDVGEKINGALEFSEKYGKTNGRERIQSLGLDSKVVADKIVKIYKENINNKN